ncbi:MAG: CPBP family intramembrane metalloprotease [Chloroflexota bacterium]|nr:CPBP family intramembrane metalloprotease [Chloroflexota bacterium]MDE3193042.1 CPBP family intramembrane metalloprotease [Chloroflexota bacterium]
MSVRRTSLALVQVAPANVEVLAFLGLALAIGWPLMLAPRSEVTSDIVAWVPGLAALAVLARASTRHLPRRIALDRLGWPDAYLLAIWVPILFVVGRIAIVVALRAGSLDPDVGGLHPASGAPPTLDAMGQLVGAVLLAPFAQILVTLGSELGWRAFLLPRLLPLGTWPAITITSLLWWAWQLPRVIDPRSAQWPIDLVAFLFWCLFVGEILAWLYLRTRSVWAPALFSATLAATAYLPSLVLRDLSPDAASPFGPAALIVPAIVVLLIRQRSEGEVRVGI